MENVVTNGAAAVRNEAALAGIDPPRWAEALRRVEILKEWCAKRRHTKAEREDAARRMGVGLKQFERLSVIWKRYGDIVRVAGGRPRGRSPASTRLPVATHAAIAEAIAALGADADFDAVRREAARRCAEAATVEASAGMVHYLLKRAREAAGAKTIGVLGERRLLVGRVQLLLALQTADGINARPDLLLAVNERNGRIVGHRLVLDGRIGTPAGELLATLREGGAMPDDAALVIAPDVAVSIRRAASGKDRPGDDEGKRSRLLSKVLGGQLGGLPLRHQGSGTAGQRPEGVAVSVADAELAVRLAVERHNAARTSFADPPSSPR